MKGVVLGLNPKALPVDITHKVPAGDIRAGVFALMASYRFFPNVTIHVTAVDFGMAQWRLIVH